MKKFALVVTSAMCAACAAFGVMTMNTATVSADVATVELSATKVMKSTAQDKMLLATAVMGYESVYEVGYTGVAESAKITAETNKYYSEIVTGETTWDAEDIFGEDYAEAGIIVWEVKYDPMVEYTFQAYAKYGEVTEEGIVVGNPETVEVGAEKTVATNWVAATSEAGADAFAVLKKEASWGSFYHGWPYLTGSDETSVWTNACQGSSPQVGFTWKAAAINEMIALGFKKITFTVTSDIGQYIVMYVDDSSTGWVSGNYDANPPYAYMHFFESGSQVTVDLVALNGQGINFASTPNVSWNVSTASQTKVTFTNIAFEKMSQAELDAQKAALAFAVFTNTSTWGSHYHGWVSDIGTDNTSFWASGNYANSDKVGFTWTKAALNSVIALGFKTITFTVSVEANKYIAIYNGNTNTDWISGNYSKDGTLEDRFYFASGSTVTIDLVKVVGYAAAEENALLFAVTSGVSWTGDYAKRKVTFSDVSFEKFTEAELEQKAAFEALKSAFITQYHGYPTSVGSDANSIWATANAGGNSAFAGFGFSKDAINAIIALGFKTMTFTVTTSAGAHVDIWGRGMSTADNHISGDIAAIEGNEYFFASGTQVTIDLVKIIEKVASLGDYPNVAIELCITNGATWKAASSQVVTFSNISFGK